MLHQVVLMEDGRISATSNSSILGPNAIEVDFPDDFDFSLQHEYRIDGMQLVHDPLPDPEPEPTERQILAAMLGLSEDATLQEKLDAAKELGNQISAQRRSI